MNRPDFIYNLTIRHKFRTLDYVDIANLTKFQYFLIAFSGYLDNLYDSLKAIASVHTSIFNWCGALLNLTLIPLSFLYVLVMCIPTYRHHQRVKIELENNAGMSRSYMWVTVLWLPMDLFPNSEYSESNDYRYFKNKEH
jgi:hypothetical protein